MTGGAAGGSTIHATALVHGGIGLLIRGASGAGKSSLALALLDDAGRTGAFAGLVADDRVVLSTAGGRLIARAPASLKGLVERYGRGIERIEVLPAARIRLVVDLVDAAADLPRMPEPDAVRTSILGVELVRQLAPARRIPQALSLTLAALFALARSPLPPLPAG